MAVLTPTLVRADPCQDKYGRWLRESRDPFRHIAKLKAKPGRSRWSPAHTHALCDHRHRAHWLLASQSIGMCVKIAGWGRICGCVCDAAELDVDDANTTGVVE